jgi:amino acid adenylation domain-containing protein
MTSTRNDAIMNEALLRELWSTLLGVSPEVEPDFMRAGGSSLLLMEIQLGLQKRSGVWIDLESLDLPIRFEAVLALVHSKSGAANSAGPDREPTQAPKVTVVDRDWPGSPSNADRDARHDSKKAWLVGDAIEKPSTLPEQVRRTALREPAAPAVRDGEEILTYGELVASADALAANLRSLEGGSERVVMIRCHPGIDYCIAVLGTISAGCFAAPINPALPESRVRMMFDLADPVAVVGGDGNDGCPRVSVERKATPDAGVPAIDLPTSLDDPCYALFTSGSTGTPKGVRMHQLPVANLARFEATRNGPEPAARTAQIAPVGFDVAFQEMFGTWAAGGELIVVPAGTRRDPARLVEFLDQQQVTRMYCVPLLLRVIARASNMLERPLHELQEVITAGEALRVDQDVREFGAACRSLRLMNQLGLAEAIQATHVDLGEDPEGWEDLPVLGGPIPGVEIRVVDGEGSVLDRGIEGEIEIGGFATGLGYIGSQESDRFFNASGTRWYRTGDQGLLTEAGRLEFRGRRDHQVKIRGFRVEIGDVEHAITSLSDIEEAAVIAVERPSGDRQLMAVVTTTGEIDEIGILEELQSTLPAWMLPQRMRVVPELPSNGNGKLDRSAIRAMFEDRSAAV